MRAFLALEIPTEIRNYFSVIMDRLRSSGAAIRWEHESKLHITMKFLGEVDPGRIESLSASLIPSIPKIDKFSVLFDTLGVFPNRRNPRIVWIGCKTHDPSLDALFQSIESEAAACGWMKEERPFHPHVTLGRIRDSSGTENLISIMENCNLEPRSALITEVLLMKSTLKPDGSEYSVMQRYRLSHNELKDTM